MLKTMGNYFSGSSSSSQNIPPAEPPPGIRKLNSTLYELVTPIGQPVVDVILFHGLYRGDKYEDAYWKAWCGENQDSETMWIQTILPESIPGVRVWSEAYDYHAQTRERNVGDNLVTDIIKLTYKKSAKDPCPIILVGHSLGGLVIKSFLNSAVNLRHRYDPVKKPHDKNRCEEIDDFMKRLSGIFFFATPHGGIPMPQKFGLGKLDSPILKLLTVLNSDTAELNEDFRKWRSKNKIRVYAIFEGKSSERGSQDLLVPYAAANSDFDEYYVAADCDHFTVCQLSSDTDSTFLELTNFISEIETVKGGLHRRVEGERANADLL